MRNRRQKTVLAVVAVAVVLLGLPAVAGAWTRRIEGRVVDTTGDPVSGLRVELVDAYSEIPRGYEDVTDSEGRYRFDVGFQNPARIKVTPRTPDDATTSEYLSMTGTDPTSVPDIIHHRRASVSGTVTLDSDWSGPTRVFVALGQPTTWYPREEDQYAEFVVHGSGSVDYRFDGVAAGDFFLVASTSRGTMTRLTPEAPGSVDLVMDPGVSQSGLDMHLTRPSDTFVGVAPTRLVDTRAGRANGAVIVPKVPVTPSAPLRVQVTGRAGVPAQGVGAVSVTATAIGRGQGFLALAPCDVRPETSTLEMQPGRAVANAALVEPDSTGAICVTASAPTDVLVDLNGYLPTSGGYEPSGPTRLLDTRPGRPAAASTVTRTKVTSGVGGSKVVPIKELLDLQEGDTLSLNVTATGGEHAGHVSIYPCDWGSSIKFLSTSTVNFQRGGTVANSTLMTDGPVTDSMCVSASAPVDVVIDVTGVFRKDSTYQPPREGRVIDTRPGRDSANPTLTGKVGPSRVLEYRRGFAWVSAVYNVIAANGEADGHLTVYPCDAPRPETSNLNFRRGTATAGSAVVWMPPNSDRLCFHSSVPVDIVVDPIGDFTATR